MATTKSKNRRSDHVAIAAGLAERYHAGQVDKVGAPYINHVRRVAASVTHLGPTHEAVALLHDILEDTEAGIADLFDAGLSNEIVTAVIVLTKVPNEPNVAYYERVRANSVARNVKLADIADNDDPLRLAALDIATRDRLTAKYHKARAALS